MLKMPVETNTPTFKGIVPRYDFEADTFSGGWAIRDRLECRTLCFVSKRADAEKIAKALNAQN
jgi:hypothetical protein